MTPGNVHYAIGMSVIVAIFVILAAMSVLNHFADARKIRYLAQAHKCPLPEVPVSKEVPGDHPGS